MALGLAFGGYLALSERAISTSVSELAVTVPALSVSADETAAEAGESEHVVPTSDYEYPRIGMPIDDLSARNHWNDMELDPVPTL